MMDLWRECLRRGSIIVASLEQDPISKRFRLRFRFAGQGCKRSLGTANKREAIASQVRFEETLRLVESGRLAIPPDTDPIDFLLSEGRSTGTKTLKLVTLGQLLDSYQQDLPPGAKEESTLYTEGIHLRHLKRILKVRQSAVSLYAQRSSSVTGRLKAACHDAFLS